MSRSIARLAYISTPVLHLDSVVRWHGAPTMCRDVTPTRSDPPFTLASGANYAEPNLL